MFHSRTTDIVVDICCMFAVLLTPWMLVWGPQVSIGLLQLALLGQIYTRLPLRRS